MRKDFFDYFPVAEQHRRWGIYATSYGHVTVPAQSPYPPVAHPENHAFGWKQGRVLSAFQLVYISQGQGEFESDLSPLTKVSQGFLFVLFPGVRHRYRPEAATGWTESWLELQGPQMEALRRLHILRPEHPVHPIGEVPEILALFTAAGQLARTKLPGFQVKLGLLGLQILTQITWPTAVPGSASQRLERVIQQALQLLASHLDQPVSPEWIARELHIGYSYFRRAFKAQTGFSPKQYRLAIRFRRTCDLLQHTDLKIKEIAQQLGYDSPYHLSVDFKNWTGRPPQLWRAQLTSPPSNPGLGKRGD
jgi:AraC-like DNA-binding protein